MNEGEPTSREIWLFLERLQEVNLLASYGADAQYEIETQPKDGYPSVLDQVSIAGMLKEKGAIQITEPAHGNGLITDLLSTRHNGFVKGFRFKTLSPKWDETLKKYLGGKGDRTSVRAPAQYWITKDDKGEYWYEGHKIFFKSPDADYAKAFRAVLSIAPDGGLIPYGKITDKCGMKKAAVLRALSGKNANFFRYVHSIPQKPGHDIPLFQARQDGKGLHFNNTR